VQIGYSAILAIFAGIFVLVGSIMFFVANLNPSKTLEVSAVDAQQNSELDKHVKFFHVVVFLSRTIMSQIAFSGNCYRQAPAEPSQEAGEPPSACSNARKYK